jgi:nitrogenase subunit NifH
VNTGAGVGSAGPGEPFTSVQFNRSGAFGGDANFIYYDGTGSVSCGPGSEITAASHQGCAIFGKNCAITD